MNAKHAVHTPTTPQAPSKGLQGPPLQPNPIVERLKAERVQEALKASSSWRLYNGALTLRKVKKFPNPHAAALYSGFVSSLAASFGTPVGVRVAARQVTVTLQGVEGRGGRSLTDEQLNFALMLT